MKKEKTGKTEKREPGRPSRYSAALAERICDHIPVSYTHLTLPTT